MPEKILKGRYLVKEKIGEGGQCFVFLCRDQKTSKELVVKQLKEKTQSLERKEENFYLFTNEYQLLKDLQHPNLPKVLDIFMEDDNYYITEEFIKGRILSSIIKQKAPLPEKQVLLWGIQLAEVIYYLHQNNIIYRDLKPKNIVVTEDEKLCLVDFSSSRIYKAQQTMDTVLIGTSGYCPPEQYGFTQTDGRSDVYSLGVILHQMLTNINPAKSPFEFALVNTINKEVTAKTSKLIEKATAFEANNRFQSIKRMKIALEEALKELEEKDENTNSVWRFLTRKIW